MQHSRTGRRGLARIRGLRGWQAGMVLGGLAIIGMSIGGVAIGAAGAAPAMQVLPSPIGVKYGQAIEVKAQNLPKGSGSIAVTVCGLNNAAGQAIATPVADDCAGANDLSSGLVKLQQWSDGSFDQQYTLPTSGQKFGTNQRFCDATHYCAVIVADANPSAPAYHLDTELQFTDQKAIGGTPTTAKPPTTTKTPTTTKGKQPTATTPVAAAPPVTSAPTTPPTEAPTTTTTAPTLSFTAGGSGSAGGNGTQGGGSASITVTVNAGTTPTLPSGLPTGSTANPIPPQAAAAITQACTQLAQVVKEGGADASSLTLACSTLVNGGGGAQLGMVLQSPSLGCFAASSLTQSNAQLADACSELATALQPYSSQLGTALAPVLALLP
jgi:hypothetical protein